MDYIVDKSSGVMRILEMCWCCFWMDLVDVSGRYINF